MRDNNLKETFYYIQNGYVGNAVLWWAKDSAGYTTDFNQAEKYTKEQTEKIIQRPQDIAWPCEYIDRSHEAQKLIIDCQYIDAFHSLRGNTK